MEKSIFNRVIPLKKSRRILVNTLSGAMDIVPGYYCEYLEKPLCEEDNDITGFLSDRCYLVGDDINEREILTALYAKLQAARRMKSPLKCVLIVTFDCNLKCSYCWQQHKIEEEKTQVLTRPKIDLILKAIKKLAGAIHEKSEQAPVVQVFGGEPLLAENAELIEYILRKCQESQYDVQITTNGVNLGRFREMILEYGVKEIQVTVDGPEDIHNRRRLGSDYQSIMDSIDKLLFYNALYVKLRVNVDHSNIHGLYSLANEIIDRRWYTNRKFYAYLAPLRDCSFTNHALIAKRRRLLAALNRLKQSFPQIEVFDVLGWDGYQPVRILENSGRFPFPKPHICDVNLNQFVFTPSGEIHLCAEEAHGQTDIVGAYYPDFSLDKQVFNRIYYSSPLDLKRCEGCAMLPVCGGGCNLLSGNEEFLGSYCKSVRDCFEYGLQEYIEGGGN